MEYINQSTLLVVYDKCVCQISVHTMKKVHQLMSSDNTWFSTCTSSPCQPDTNTGMNTVKLHFIHLELIHVWYLLSGTHSENLLCSRTNTFKVFLKLSQLHQMSWQYPFIWCRVINVNPTLLQLASISYLFLSCLNVFLQILGMALQITGKPLIETTTSSMHSA